MTKKSEREKIKNLTSGYIQEDEYKEKSIENLYLHIWRARTAPFKDILNKVAQDWLDNYLESDNETNKTNFYDFYCQHITLDDVDNYCKNVVFEIETVEKQTLEEKNIIKQKHAFNLPQGININSEEAENMFNNMPNYAHECSILRGKFFATIKQIYNYHVLNFPYLEDKVYTPLKPLLEKYAPFKFDLKKTQPQTV